MELLDGRVAARGLRAVLSDEAYGPVSDWLVELSMRATFTTRHIASAGGFECVFSFPLQWLVSVISNFDPDHPVDMFDKQGEPMRNIAAPIYEAIDEIDFEELVNWLQSVDIMMTPVAAALGLQVSISWLANAVMFSDPLVT